jgi:hypothetical protein
MPEYATAGPQRVYLAGPISGIKDRNREAFDAAQRHLEGRGMTVVNPLKVNPAPAPWAECMRRDIPELLGCDTIALLPGWEASEGASMEHYIAEKLGMNVLYLFEVRHG